MGGEEGTISGCVPLILILLIPVERYTLKGTKSGV